MVAPALREPPSRVRGGFAAPLDSAALALHLAGSFGILTSSLSFPGLIFRKKVANKGHFKIGLNKSRVGNSAF